MKVKTNIKAGLTCRKAGKDGNHNQTLARDPKKNLPPPPVLATNIGNGVLRLNMGPFAAARERGNITDGNEAFTVIHVSGTVTGEAVEVQAGAVVER